jgi:hypothetical protein
MGSITWPNGQDFCPDTLYEESIKINWKKNLLIHREWANLLRPKRFDIKLNLL